jgi:hypothetical protein
VPDLRAIHYSRRCGGPDRTWGKRLLASYGSGDTTMVAAEGRHATRFSTGAVSSYSVHGCDGPDLPATIEEARSFAAIFLQAGHQIRSRWENADVWG